MADELARLTGKLRAVVHTGRNPQPVALYGLPAIVVTSSSRPSPPGEATRAPAWSAVSVASGTPRACDRVERA